MSYTSYFYLLFFLGALVILYYLMPLKRRWLVLLGGSYFFYWLASGKLIVFLLITTVSVYLGALAMEREQKAFDSVRKSLEKEERKARKAAMMRRKRHIVLAMVLINVGLLAFLKYYHFFSANVNALGNSLNLGIQLPALKLVMPLGISFYTLSAVGYVIDVYRGQTAADIISEDWHFFSVYLRILRRDLSADTDSWQGRPLKAIGRITDNLHLVRS